MPRARVDKKPQLATGWWICTDFFRNGGEAWMGPFISREQALAVRYYVEQVEKPLTFCVDEAVQSGGSSSSEASDGQ